MAPSNARPLSGTEPLPKPPRTKPHAFWFVTFGILLPTFTLGFELVTRMCGEALFDPLPTWGHVLLVAAVPITNGYIFWALSHQHSAQRDRLRLANGFVLGATGFYTLLFLPIAPFAAVAIVFYGLGFLPLAPLLASIPFK